MSRLHRIGLTRRELATVLAALRFWQRAAFFGECAIPPEMPEQDIATDGQKIKPMTADAIDDLCLRLNSTTHGTEPLPEPLTSVQDAELLRAAAPYASKFREVKRGS